MGINTSNGFSSNGTGGGGGSTITVVANYSALPAANTVPNKFYWCENSQGTKWLPFSLGGTYYNSGLYYSNGVSWTYMETPYQATQLQVDTGTNNDTFVTPLTLENAQKWSVVGSGLYQGGVVSINGSDNTKIDISAGQAYWVEYALNSGTPVLNKVIWTAKISVTVTYLNTNTFSFIGIDKNGNVTQYSNIPTNTERRSAIMLAQLGHANLSTVNSVNDYVSVYPNPVEQYRDLVRELYLINDGNTVVPNGANLNINKTAGYLFGMGINFHTDQTNPNRAFINSQTVANFRYRTQTGGSTAPVNLIAPTVYDNAGVITAIGGSNNQATNQRVFLFQNGNLVIQYGQTIYSTLGAAISAVQTESFVKFSNLNAAILIGIISVTKGCTDLSNTNQARFILTTKFGENIGGTAGISVSTLQNAYNNSADPEIITDSTRGALTIQRGSAADTDDVFEIKNGAGVQTVYIRGNGDNNLVAHRKYFAYDNTTVTVTSSTLETVMRNIPITGGGIGINGKLEIYSNTQKITVSSSSYTLRFYYCTVGTNVIGTTGVPTGGTLLGTCTGTTSAQNYTPFVRRLINKNAENLNEIVLIGTNMYNDNTGNLNTQITTTNFDTSVNWWLVMTCQMVGAGDTVNQRDIQLYIDKP
jgi:hypothetical protein